MKVILYMAMTINGFIAKENDDTSFVSEIEWDSFRNMIKSTGNMIIGSRTYAAARKTLRENRERRRSHTAQNRKRTRKKTSAQTIF